VWKYTLEWSLGKYLVLFLISDVPSLENNITLTRANFPDATVKDCFFVQIHPFFPTQVLALAIDGIGFLVPVREETDVFFPGPE
jgi:hypothetical protein